MSLLSLKCSTPSAKPQKVSIDSFIEEAELYANGKSTDVSIDGTGIKCRSQNYTDEELAKFTRCTFTLSDCAKTNLTKLSLSTGIARSRLIRIWLDQLEKGEVKQDFMNSSVR